MIQVCLGLGSNVEPERNLRAAVATLAGALGDFALSPVYRSQAVGFEGDAFLNLVALGYTERTIAELLELIEELHAAAGRRRGGSRFAARTLDVDLLSYGGAVDPALGVPRSDITRYDFVLVPLTDLAPNFQHPLTGEAVSGLRSHHDSALELVQCELM